MEALSLLSQGDEDTLHKERLLSVEEKPFKRVTKRLLALTSVVGAPVAQLPPASTTASNGNAEEDGRQQREHEWERFREDVTLDFAAFNSSIARMQSLLTSNEEERKQYEIKKVKILEESQAVRESTAQRHLQLAEARKTLEVRKTWDELSEKITGNRMLRPREDQEANLQRLHAEIAELERERAEYGQTWAERREQFGRIVKESTELRRLIRDEKEEVERREGIEVPMDVIPQGTPHVGTPRIDTPRIDTPRIGTPRIEAEPEEQVDEMEEGEEVDEDMLRVPEGASPSGTAPMTATSGRSPSASGDATQEEAGEAGDEMDVS
ncbi:MAG: Arginine N-methyltransferase 2 [Watsoniomyces obsoletus]|nr:MAG: Arginine N-methyltransferase 2 [Watsoniomyces obsoletus]